MPEGWVKSPVSKFRLERLHINYRVMIIDWISQVGYVRPLTLVIVKVNDLARIV